MFTTIDIICNNLKIVFNFTLYKNIIDEIMQSTNKRKPTTPMTSSPFSPRKLRPRPGAATAATEQTVANSPLMQIQSESESDDESVASISQGSSAPVKQIGSSSSSPLQTQHPQNTPSSPTHSNNILTNDSPASTSNEKPASPAHSNIGSTATPQTSVS